MGLEDDVLRGILHQRSRKVAMESDKGTSDASQLKIAVCEHMH